MEILKFSRKHPNKAINKCNEIYGACRHKPRFHRFDRTQTVSANASTVESEKDERVQRPSSTTSQGSSSSSLLATTGSFSDQRENELLFDVDPDVGCGFITNRREGVKARYHLGLERESLHEDDIESNLDQQTPDGDLPLRVDLEEV